ncbi:hypothetical protein QTP70_024249 [Hemibagrus guttatus]|uniref:Tc1-like transposase DDE domain-containing protein n=1 Tax=Hemibagrus guttatus TaxID=175788 RepID=A0AAE0RKQ5_9TELE|nr:hypothetical protein QTP70_024249 [Hemibagrus guttatus]
MDAHSSSEHFCGKRKRRMETTDEEDSDEEGPPRKRQHVEQEDDVHELSNLGSSSSSSWSSSPILDSIPSMDAHSSSEHFCGKRKRRMETSDEEAPPRKRLCNLGSSSSSSLTLSPTLELIPTIDSSSSDFWWRMMMRRRELMSGEEVTNDEEVPHARWESVEPEDDEFEVFEDIGEELISFEQLILFFGAYVLHRWFHWLSVFCVAGKMGKRKDLSEFDKGQWFDEHNNEFEVLTWPPNSPNLNPIEHLWDVLNKQVRSMEASPHNLQDLKDLLLTFWCQIPHHTFRDLVESMPQRVRAVLAAKGGLTQY